MHSTYTRTSPTLQYLYVTVCTYTRASLTRVSTVCVSLNASTVHYVHSSPHYPYVATKTQAIAPQVGYMKKKTIQWTYPELEPYLCQSYLIIMGITSVMYCNCVCTTSKYKHSWDVFCICIFMHGLPQAHTQSTGRVGKQVKGSESAIC